MIKHIKLEDGATLRLATRFNGGPDVWKLHRGNSEMRVLDIFEQEFIFATIRAMSEQVK